MIELFEFEDYDFPSNLDKENHNIINLFEDLVGEKIKEKDKTVTFNMFCQELIEREYHDDEKRIN